MNCVYCGQPVEPKRDFQLAYGWTKSRSGGGTNQLVMKRLKDKFAHASCVMVRRDGRLGQEKLV